MSWLYTKQKKARLEAEARARGEVVDVLVREAPGEFRMQLWYAIERVPGADFMGNPHWRAIAGEVHSTLLDEYGRGRLSKGTGATSWEEDFRTFVLRDASTEELMDVINGVLVTLAIAANQNYTFQQPLLDVISKVRQRLDEHRLAWDLVNGEIVERDSMELHAEVVAPALTLLHGRKRFTAAEGQYRDALDEISKNKFGDAVTDANASVEIVLRTLLGLEQGQLPGLLAEARKRGLFGDAQETRTKKFVDGLAALSDVRNKEGDAHGHEADRETAWLAVHWAGALIVFLVERAEALGA